MRSKVRTRIGSILVCLAMLLSLLPTAALAVDEPVASSTTIEIDSNEKLVDAIQNQADGQTWVFIKDGIYDAKNTAEGSNGTYKYSGYSYPLALPIYANNLTIKKADGVGEVTITSSYEAKTANWHDQNFITVYGDNLTIDGVNIKANKNTSVQEGSTLWYDGLANKAIEFTADSTNFTLKNMKLIALENENGQRNSGSIWVGCTDVGTSSIENVEMASFISGGDYRGELTVTNLTQDYTDFNRAGVATSEGYYLCGIRPTQSGTLTVTGLTVKVDDSINLTEQVFTERLPEGSTVELAAGTYNVKSPLTIDKNVKVVGAVDADGNPATTLKGDNDSTSHGIVITGSADVTLENLEITEFGGAKQNNSAIKAGDDNSRYSGKLTVDNCIVSEFGKGGIVVKGGEADIKNTTVDVTNVNNVDNRAPNGIQIDQGAKASITDCTVIDSSSSAEEWSATGVLVLRGAQITTISGNTFEHCDVAVTASTIYDSDSDLSGRTTSLPKDAINNNTFDNCDTKVLREVPVLAGQENANANGDALLDTLANAADGDYIAIPDNKGEISINLGNEAVIPTDSTLSVDKNVTLTGNITNNGTMTNEGTITGTLTNNGSITNFGKLPEGVTGDVTAGVLVDSEEALLDAIAANDGKTVITLDANIILSDTLNLNKNITIDGNGHTISTTAIATTIPAVNNESLGYSAIIAATNDAKVVLKDLIVKGDPTKTSPNPGGADLIYTTRYIGVAAINADLTMEGCKVLDITYEGHLQGMQNGHAIYAVSDSAKTLTVNNTEIANFNKTAVIARDKINLIVNGCTITGFGEQATIGQNGIQYAGNATIENTKISGLVYNADNEWKNCSTAIYNVSTGTTTNTVLQNVVCENVDSSYYTTGGTTTISGGSFEHVGANNAAVAGDEGVSIAITGGKFDSDVSKYLAPGYAIDDEGNVYKPYTGGSSSSGYQVSVDKATNGKVTVNTSRADKGDTVTITVTPDKGYELDKLTVTDKNGDTIKLTDKGNGKYTFTMPGGKVTVKAVFVEKSTELPFVDVAKNAYYYDAVAWAVENGVTNGTSATTFGPDLAVTRAQMVTFLWRAHGSPKATGTNPFTDVSTSDYYYDAVLWAVANGVTNGTSATTFSPDMAVTRAQAVTFQWRAAGSTVVTGSSFDDVAADAYYADAVTWAVANDITNGTSSNTFSPDAIVSRAQAVTFLYRELV